MKVLLTGATGYIGKRLLPVLLSEGHQVVCCVRDPERFNPPQYHLDQISVIQVDFLQPETMQRIPDDIEAAYYLIHSMSSDSDFSDLELKSAINFREALVNTGVKQVIYLSGIVNEDELSEHLASRLHVEEELKKGDYALTTLRAGIIIGSGSASFEIIRDLVEKLPVMIAPRWLDTKCQPIGVADVLNFLKGCLGHSSTFDRDFDIGGPDVLSYKEMLLGFARVRGLTRKIWTVPVMTPRLSSYWLYFVTSTSYKLATALVDSMKVEVVCRDNDLARILGIQPIDYKTALERAFEKIKANEVASSWKDALSSGRLEMSISDFIEVPTFGCFIDKRVKEPKDRGDSIDRIWRIGGKTGWYYATWLWKVRGYLDKLWGGVGLRRGRTNEDTLEAGDAVDFWRVLYANKDEGRLLLFAEMKLPGEAWLEFRMTAIGLEQTATFRPKGVLGRLYWYSVLPFHGFIFRGMLERLTR